MQQIINQNIHQIINQNIHSNINQNIHQIINQNIHYNILPIITQKLQRYIVMETVTACIP